MKKRRYHETTRAWKWRKSRRGRAFGSTKIRQLATACASAMQILVPETLFMSDGDTLRPQTFWRPVLCSK